MKLRQFEIKEKNNDRLIGKLKVLSEVDQFMEMSGRHIFNFYIKFENNNDIESD